MQRHVDVVDQQVEDCAAAAGGIALPFAPVGPGAASAKRRGAQRADAGKRSFERTIRGKESQHVGDHRDALRRAGLFDHPVAGSGGEGHGLLDQHVFPAAQGFDRDGLMKIGGQAEIDRVDLRVSEGGGNFAVYANA